MNAFSNDGSFMEQFLKRQRLNEGGSASGVGGDDQQQPPQQGGYEQQGYYNNSSGYNDYYPPPPQGGYPPQDGGYNEGYYGNSFNQPPPPPHQQYNNGPNQPPPPHQIGGKQVEPTKIVWAGNVHPDSTEEEVRALFSQFGYIQAIKIIPAKQCAFITYADINCAIAAQYNLNGTPIRGYPLKLGFGKVENAPPQIFQQTQQFKGGPPQFEEAPTKNLWLGNIGPSVTSEYLKQLFDPFGNVDNIRILVGRGCAFVNFFTVDSAINARNNLSGTMVHGMPLKINFRKEDESYKARGGYGGPPQGGSEEFGGGGSGGQITTPPTRPGMRPPRPPRENHIPLPAPPPQNPQEQQIIDSFAEYVHRVGPRFENFTADKQKNNPLFIFLKPRNPSNDYYKWKLWTIRNPDTHSSSSSSSNNNTNQQQSQDQQSQQPQPQPQQQNYPSSFLTENEVTEFKDILSNLTTSRQSVTNCKNWIMGHTPNALEIISIIVVNFQQNASLNFSQKLNILHVLNDCLHNSVTKRTTPDDWMSDEFARSIKEYLPFIVGTTASGESPENQDKVLKVLTIWENQKFYDKQFIDSLKNEANDDDNE